MSAHHPHSVKFTGARAGACLVGVQWLNAGLIVRVEGEQVRDDSGGRVAGAFALLNAGWGEYSVQLAGFVGQRFGSAREFFTELQRMPRAQRATHLLNRGALVYLECPYIVAAEPRTPAGGLLR